MPPPPEHSQASLDDVTLGGRRMSILDAMPGRPKTARDLKVIALSTTDRWATKVTSLADVEALAPGTLDRLLFWFSRGKTGRSWGGDTSSSSEDSGSSSAAEGASAEDKYYGKYRDKLESTVLKLTHVHNFHASQALIYHECALRS